MKINFISNIPENEYSGGFSAVNHAIWLALREIAEVHYVGPVRPPMDRLTKYVSKLSRMAGLAGSFAAYADSRLRRIAKEVKTVLASDADLDFFTGLTPWVHCPLERPRIAWTDCSFRDYLGTYHKGTRFQSKDIERIAVAESGFARSCEKVLITSDWALSRAETHWNCPSERLCNIGIFGNETGSIALAQAPNSHLLFSSTNFQAKGGHVVLEVFTRLRRLHPNLELVIIGDTPTSISGKNSGIRCLGYLSKSDPVQHVRYRNALANAFCLLLPTRSDMSPLTPLEAAAFGTPTIAYKSFAIPELIVNGRTGILLDPTSSADAIANAVNELMSDKLCYEKMRDEAQKYFLERFTKDKFQHRVIQQMRNIITSEPINP